MEFNPLLQHDPDGIRHSDIMMHPDVDDLIYPRHPDELLGQDRLLPDKVGLTFFHRGPQEFRIKLNDIDQQAYMKSAS